MEERDFSVCPRQQKHYELEKHSHPVFAARFVLVFLPSLFRFSAHFLLLSLFGPSWDVTGVAVAQLRHEYR